MHQLRKLISIGVAGDSITYAGVYYGTRVNFCPPLTFLPLFFPRDKNTPPSVFFTREKNAPPPYSFPMTKIEEERGFWEIKTPK